MEAALDYAIMRAVALVPEWLPNPYIRHADLHWYDVHGIGRVSTGIKRFLH